MSPLFRRTGALVASSVLAVTGVTLLSAPAQAVVPRDTRPVQAGTAWLQGELVNGVLGGNCGPFDCGNTIDAGLALKAVGADQTKIDAIGTGLATPVASVTPVLSYIEPSATYDGDGNGTPEVHASKSAGATGKTLLLLRNLSTPTNTIAGIDLKTRLESMVASTAPIAGRIEDVATTDGTPDPSGDFANVVGQTFAAAALFAAGSDKADEVTDFLLTQQCDAGFFRVFYPSDPVTYAPDKTGPQDCQSGVATFQSDPDIDATATAVRLLQPQAAGNQAVEAVLDKATDWLLAQQQADGSFIAGFPVNAKSANSTGLAGWALGLRGQDAAAEKAAVWLRSHQADEVTGCANALSSAPGAMAATDDGLAAALVDGIEPGLRDSFRRATAQSLPALAYAPAATGGLSITGPTGFVKGGTTAAYRISGVAPGEKVCASGVGGAKRLVAGSAGTTATTFAMPAVTANRIVAVRNRANTSDSVLTSVLGAKTFRVTASKAVVKTGKRVTVTVTGLKPAEPVIINLRGVRKRAGVANTKGVFVGTFVVTGAKGKAVITAQGAFPAIRRGTTSIKIVR